MSNDTPNSWSGGNGAWTDPSRWSAGAPPTASDVAVFATGADDPYVVSGSGTAHSLHVYDAVELSGAITLAVADLDDNGTLTVLPGGSITASGAGHLRQNLYVVDQGSISTDGLIVEGTLDLGDENQAGTLVDTGGITVASGGTITIADGTVTAQDGLTLDHKATLILSATGAFNGALTLQGGTLSTESGSFSSATAATILVASSSTIAAGKAADLVLTGSVTIDPGTNLLIGADAKANAGWVEMAGPVSAQGATIEVGAGNVLELDQNFTGQARIDANGTLQIASPVAGQQVLFGSPTDGALPHGGVLRGALSILGQSDLSNSHFSVGDAIDISDHDALKHQITTQYDPTSGRLQVLVDGAVQQTISLPANLTGKSCFSVATDGQGGTTIALVPAPTSILALSVNAEGAWQEGATGLGITIGVISDGLNSNGGLWQSIANHLLPNSAGTNYDPSWDEASSGTDEGRAMAEIVHEVAPGADILFASSDADAIAGAPWLAGAASSFDSRMTAAVLHLANSGAKVIVDDITSTTEPFYDTGTLLSETIANLKQQGIVFVTAASNRGNVSFERPIAVEQTTTLSTNQTPVFAYRFSAGSTEASFLQQVTIVKGSDGVKPVTFQWTDTGMTPNSLHLLFFTQSGGSFVAANVKQTGTSTNQVYNPAAGTYFIAVVSDTATPSGIFKFILDNSADSIAGISPSGSGSITGHGLDPNEITVGAINANNTPAGGGTLQNEPFSSAGPGALIQGGVLIPQGKPDLSAPQRTYTSVMGVASQDNPTGISGLNNFGGTSAAAPVVAATAAMMKQADSSLTDSDIRNLLKDSCWAMQDTVTAGSGLLRADLAVSYAQTHVISQFAGGNSILYGTQQDERIVTSIGNTTVDSAGGSDTVSAGGQNTSIIGGTGTLLVDVTAGAVQVSQGSGSVTVHGGGAGSLVQGGTNGHNLLQGGNGGGAFWGGGAGDTVTGGAGDLIGSASQGNATLVGSNGTVLVDNSNDWSFTGQKGTVFTANAGNADVVVGNGDFTAVGRGGTTTVFGGTGTSAVWAQNSAVTDVAGVGRGTLVVGSGHTDLWINNVAGAQDILALAGSGGGSVDVRGFRSGIDTFSTAGYTPGKVHTSVSGNDTVVTLSDNSQITFIGVTSLA